jgi:hypothetical protein
LCKQARSGERFILSLIFSSGKRKKKKKKMAATLAWRLSATNGSSLATADLVID